MTTQELYQQVATGESLDIFLVLAGGAALSAWVFIRLLGELITTPLLRLLGPGRAAPVNVFVTLAAGLWGLSVLAPALGLVGAFTRPGVWLSAGLIVGGALWLRRKAPAYRMNAWKTLTSGGAAVNALGGFAIVLFGVVAALRMYAWFDGNFAAAGNHLVQTGHFMIEHSDAQPGMAAIAALPGVFFPKMSVLTSVLGWAPFFALLIFTVSYFLIREFTGERRWALFGFVILIFPIAFKALEIRGSAAGFPLAVGGLIFLRRYLRTGKHVEGLGAVFALAAAWNYGQLGAFFGFLLMGFWSLASWLSGARESAHRIWRVFFWLSLIEWPLLVLSFKWGGMGETVSFWKAAAPGTLALAFSAVMVVAIPRLPRVRVHEAFLAVPVVCAALAAFLMNPPWEPVYNWFFFKGRTDFLFMNFGSYAVWGWGFALGLPLILAVASGWDGPEGRLKGLREASRLVAGAFFVSCMAQIFCAVGLMAGWEGVLPLRVYFWDIWKDTTLFWICPFMVLGWMIVLRAVAAVFPGAIRIPYGEKGVAAAVILVAAVPSHAAGPWWPNDKLGAWYASWSGDHVYPVLKGQQIYPLPLYLISVLAPGFQAGDTVRRTGCTFCTIYGDGGLGGMAMLVDHLLDAGARHGETLATAESVMTHEVYVSRQIRYANGVNTVSPIYISLLDGATVFEDYWKPGGRIRRNKYGMAYTVSDAGRNLVWVPMKPDDGGTVSGSFEVPFSGRYEIYRGTEFAPAPAPVEIEGVSVARAEEPLAGHFQADAGKRYRVRFHSADADMPVAIYPRRDNRVERALLDHYSNTRLGVWVLLRFTGVRPAELVVSELRALFDPSRSGRREEVMNRHGIRWLIVDSAVRMMFPGAEAALVSSGKFDHRRFGQFTVFEKRD